MIQILSGSLTSMCRACRFNAPKSIDNRWVWHCPHRGVEIIEASNRIVVRRLPSATVTMA